MPDTATTEKPVTDEDLDAIEGALEAALGVLRLSAESDPADVQQAIDRVLSTPEARDRATEELGEHLGYALGAAWGDSIVRKFGWHWTRVAHGAWETVAIVDPTCRFLAVPFSYLAFAARTAYERINVVPIQLYAAIGYGKLLPEAEPGDFVIISDESTLQETETLDDDSCS